MDDDILRILVATDNHLGYAERDSIRCNDSFAAFEEVLLTAKEKHVDFVLLAGDMFHENRPSRRTIHTAMGLLRTHCLGEEPVFIEVINEQSEVFKTGPLNRVNYEDPFQSVSLPIFAIHGNHDDPSREGGSGESLAALDLLSVSNLINYFGKADEVDNILITPILIRKGTTFIALYGLGAIRDERLNRMWNLKKVKFVRPSEDQGKDRFFNIFVLHQNRDYGRGSKNCVHESMIPQWMDVVIWGNEHECQPRLSESLVGTFRIYQPGSSVCTSLVEGESMSHPKGMGILEIKLKKFRLKAIPFTQIRPFIYQDICLQDEQGLDVNDPKVEEKIKEILRHKVNSMIQDAREKSVEVIDAFPDKLKYRILNPQQVLVRLRVEHNNFPVVNQQRFGSQFVGLVGNPSELLLFGKKKQENLRAVETDKGKKNVSALKTIQEGEEDAIMKINIEDLVNETLTTGNKSLGVLIETEMAQALEDFVVKKQATAISDMVQETLSRMQKELSLDKEAQGKSGITEAAAKMRRKTEDSIQAGEKQRHVKGDLRKGMKAMVSDEDGEEFAEEEEEEPKGGGKEKGRGAVKAVSQRGKKSASEAPVKKAPKASPKKGRKVLNKVVQKGKKKSESDSEDDKNEDDNQESDGDYDDVRRNNGKDDNNQYGTNKKNENKTGGMIDLCDSDDNDAADGARGKTSNGSSSRAGAGNSGGASRKSTRGTTQQKKIYKEERDEEEISEDGFDSQSDYDNGDNEKEVEDNRMDDERDGGRQGWKAENGGRKAVSVSSIPATKDKKSYGNANSRGRSSDSNVHESVNDNDDGRWDQSQGKGGISSYFSGAPPTATSARGDQSQGFSQPPTGGGGTGPKKRQLPLNFSQKSDNTTKKSGKNSLANDWG